MPVCKNIIIAGWKTILKFPEGLTHQSPDSVPSHGSELTLVRTETGPYNDRIYRVAALPCTRVSLHSVHRQELARSKLPVSVHT